MELTRWGGAKKKRGKTLFWIGAEKPSHGPENGKKEGKNQLSGITHAGRDRDLVRKPKPKKRTSAERHEEE